MQFDVITLFPEIFAGYRTQSILAKAIASGLVDIRTHNLRDWSTDAKHAKVDDRPFGGGPGMLLMVEPTVRCVEEIRGSDSASSLTIMLTPRGERLDQSLLEELAAAPVQNYVLLCGRYEGFDQRVTDLLQPREISIGDYVLNGGEVAAMVLIDGLIRLVPGVLGDEQSSLQDSFARGSRRLEYPQYTRPRSFRGLDVPPVLLSGDHGEIEAWRQQQSDQITQQRRSDLTL